MSENANVSSIRNFVANSGSTFLGCTFDDPDIEKPIDLGNGNVIFPRDWDDDARAYYRAAMDQPGFETWKHRQSMIETGNNPPHDKAWMATFDLDRAVASRWKIWLARIFGRRDGGGYWWRGKHDH